MAQYYGDGERSKFGELGQKTSDFEQDRVGRSDDRKDKLEGEGYNMYTGEPTNVTYNAEEVLGGKTADPPADKWEGDAFKSVLNDFGLDTADPKKYTDKKVPADACFSPRHISGDAPAGESNVDAPTEERDGLREPLGHTGSDSGKSFGDAAGKKPSSNVGHISAKQPSLDEGGQVPYSEERSVHEPSALDDVGKNEEPSALPGVGQIPLSEKSADEPSAPADVKVESNSSLANLNVGGAVARAVAAYESIGSPETLSSAGTGSQDLREPLQQKGSESGMSVGGDRCDAAGKDSPPDVGHIGSTQPSALDDGEQVPYSQEKSAQEPSALDDVGQVPFSKARSAEGPTALDESGQVPFPDTISAEEPSALDDVKGESNFSSDHKGAGSTVAGYENRGYTEKAPETLHSAESGYQDLREPLGLKGSDSGRSIGDDRNDATEEKHSSDVGLFSSKQPSALDEGGQLPCSEEKSALEPSAVDDAGQVPFSGARDAEAASALDDAGQEPFSGARSAEEPPALGDAGQVPFSGARDAEAPSALDDTGKVPLAGARDAEVPSAIDDAGKVPFAGARDAEAPSALDDAGKVPFAGARSAEEPSALDDAGQVPSAEKRSAVEPCALDDAGQAPFGVRSGEELSAIDDAGQAPLATRSADEPSALDDAGQVPSAEKRSAVEPSALDDAGQAPLGAKSAEESSALDDLGQAPFAEKSAEVPSALDNAGQAPFGERSAEEPSAPDDGGPAPFGEKSAEKLSAPDDAGQVPIVPVSATRSMEKPSALDDGGQAPFGARPAEESSSLDDAGQVSSSEERSAIEPPALDDARLAPFGATSAKEPSVLDGAGQVPLVPFSATRSAGEPPALDGAGQVPSAEERSAEEPSALGDAGQLLSGEKPAEDISAPKKDASIEGKEMGAGYEQSPYTQFESKEDYDEKAYGGEGYQPKPDQQTEGEGRGGDEGPKPIPEQQTEGAEHGVPTPTAADVAKPNPAQPIPERQTGVEPGVPTSTGADKYDAKPIPEQQTEGAERRGLPTPTGADVYPDANQESLPPSEPPKGNMKEKVLETLIPCSKMDSEDREPQQQQQQQQQQRTNGIDRSPRFMEKLKEKLTGKPHEPAPEHEAADLPHEPPMTGKPHEPAPEREAADVPHEPPKKSMFEKVKEKLSPST